MMRTIFFLLTIVLLVSCTEEPKQVTEPVINKSELYRYELLPDPESSFGGTRFYSNYCKQVDVNCYEIVIVEDSYWFNVYKGDTVMFCNVQAIRRH